MSQTQERIKRFTAVVRADVDACGAQARLEGSLAFRRWMVDDLEQTTQRALDRASLSVHHSDGVHYDVVGTADLDPAEAPLKDDRFDVVHRGVLVGPGRLNNHLITLAVRVAEQPDGAAEADVLRATVDCS